MRTCRLHRFPEASNFMHRQIVDHDDIALERRDNDLLDITHKLAKTALCIGPLPFTGPKSLPSSLERGISWLMCDEVYVKERKPRTTKIPLLVQTKNICR